MKGAAVREIPPLLLDNQKQSMLKFYAANASQYGMELSAYLTAAMGISSTEELLESNKASLEDAAKDKLVRQALFEEMGLSAGDEEVAAYFKDVLGVTDYSDYRDYYGMPYIRMMVMSEQMMNRLSQQAVRQ